MMIELLYGGLSERIELPRGVVELPQLIACAENVIAQREGQQFGMEGMQ